MEEKIIYHISSHEDWEKGKERGNFVVPSLEKEGFIHFSRSNQLEGTANRYYKGRQDLILLTIDVGKLKHSELLKYEKSSTHTDTFPHLYTSLNTDAVIQTIPIIPESDGSIKINLKL